MNKEQELYKLMSENPNLKIITFYPEEHSDSYYTVGRISKVLIDEYYCDDDRAWLKNNDWDEIVEHYADYMYDELFPQNQILTDNESKVCEIEAIKQIESFKWEKVIVVYIRVGD